MLLENWTEFGRMWQEKMKKCEVMERREFLRKGLLLSAGLVPGMGVANGLLGDALQDVDIALPQTVKRLIDSSAGLIVNKYERTPLHNAVLEGNLEVVRKLVEAGADLEATDEYFETPLCLATQENHVEISEYLISCGADPLNFNSVVEVLEIRIAKNLVPLVAIPIDNSQQGNLKEFIQVVRSNFTSIVGFSMPRVRIRDYWKNLKDNQYQIVIFGQQVASGSFIAEQERWKEFTNTVTSQLLEVTLVHSDKLLTLMGTKQLLDDLKSTSPALVDKVTPGIMTIKEVQDVLQLLLKEQIPVKRLGTILETLLEHGVQTKDPIALCEHVRQRLAVPDKVAA